jgi:hypothetical protein
MEGDSNLVDRMPHDEPGLGLLSRVPRELRDKIYDLCHQDKHYTNKLCYESSRNLIPTNPGTVRIKIHAPLPQLRLLSKQLTHEYDSRAPANAVMFNGAIMRDSYSFELDQNAPKDAMYLPRFTKEEEAASRHDNLSVTRFEIAGILSYSLETEYLGRIAETPPLGSVRLSLRFYDDPPSDLQGFMEVFGDLQMSYTEGRRAGGQQLLRLVEVTLLAGGWPLTVDKVPVIGTWTPQDGFKFNGVASGVYEWRETPGISDQSSDSDSDGGSDGEGDCAADGATEETPEDSNDSDDASQSGSEMDRQFDEKSDNLEASDESDKARDNPSLGLFSKLPIELRYEIYNLCTQEKHYEIHDSGPLRFQVHAPLSPCRLVSKVFSSEYQSRAPANAIMTNRGRGYPRYTLQLGNSAPKQVQHPRTTETPCNGTNALDQHGNLKTTSFEIVGLRTWTSKSPWHQVNTRPQTPTGTFVLVLRFYQDPRSDLASFMRVFDDLRVSWTCTLYDMTGHSLLRRLGPTAIQLHDVTFLLSGDPGTQYYSDTLPEIGTWTPDGGFEFNEAEQGIMLEYSESDDDTWVERHDTGL